MFFLPFFDVFIAFLSYMTVGEENIAVGVHLMLSVAVCVILTYVTWEFLQLTYVCINLTYVDHVFFMLYVRELHSYVR